MAADGTVWERGRFDARDGSKRVLFGRMYEDPYVELERFGEPGRVFCIASAGCTALALSTRHEVVAVDINPVQLEYARARLQGAPMRHGTAEKVMGIGRGLAPVAGWTRGRLEAFCDLDDPEAQRAYWEAHLNTWRFRFGLDLLLSVTALRAFYSSPLLASLPPRFGRVLRARMERGLFRHPNRDNEWARALFLGELSPGPAEARPDRITLEQMDAAGFLENAPAHSFDGFTLSNILDGATDGYRRRLFDAIRHAAKPGAKVALRSFGEPSTGAGAFGDPRFDAAAEDRSLLWGVVDVRLVSELPT